MHNSPHLGNIPVMQARLRTLIDQVARSAEADAVLLRRFVSARDSAAFAELVRRYGRLVWGQCRHLLASEADADDAFQATFLTLSRAARTVKQTNKLGPWLHGVAYRVCLNAKRLAARRTKREKATAKAEATRPVADSAWDAAFAAVHDELAKLPETLRVPFVLCVLEGKGTTQAAEQLGLKLGTLSSRLSRAKQTLFERLNARGLTAGLAAVGAVALGATAVPAAVATKACDLAAGGAAPANILSLSHGVLGMAAMNAKRWVMAAVLGCGLAAGVGGVWQANAQDAPKKELPPRPGDTDKEELARLKKLLADEEAKLREAEDRVKQKALADEKAREAKEKEKGPDGKSKYTEMKAPEFMYFPQAADYAPTAEEFEKVVKKYEAGGYRFVGLMSITGYSPERKGAGPAPTLIFRRVVDKGTVVEDATDKEKRLKFKEVSDAEQKALADRLAEREKALLAEIDALKLALTELRGNKKGVKGDDRFRAVFRLDDLGVPDLDFEAGKKLLGGLLRLRFGDGAVKKVEFSETGKTELTVTGLDDEGVKYAHWLADQIKGLKGEKPQGK